MPLPFLALNTTKMTSLSWVEIIIRQGVHRNHASVLRKIPVPFLSRRLKPKNEINNLGSERKFLTTNKNNIFYKHLTVELKGIGTNFELRLLDKV